MNLPLLARTLFALFISLCALCSARAKDEAKAPEVPCHKIFEVSLGNQRSYSNKFTEVELRCVYKAPSGREISFPGFYDGDGLGGGDATTGTVWKLRFMPDETGTWHYTWNWSDGSGGGSARFECVQKGAGKGILRAYDKNPRWFAYGGKEPVWLKSYYETGHGSIAQPFDWVVANVYQPILDRGYNHLQVNWLLSLCCFEQFYKDGPAPTSKDLTLYTQGKASSTMRLDVWRMMEQHLGWLNDRNVGVHMFLGFEGRKNGGPKWEALDEQGKDFLVRYAVARLAPHANLSGWNFVWEDPGHRETHELGLARLLAKYDVFQHLRTYEDEHPRQNEYKRPEYTFAAIENHLIAGRERAVDMLHWKTPWTHHAACIEAYEQGKPVYMSEGNALWRRYWSNKAGATQEDLRRAAWACVTGGASFCWNGHAGEAALYAKGPEGLPFGDPTHPYAKSAVAIDVVADVMTREFAFQDAEPSDFLLTEHDPLRTWCLANPGHQYLVFTTAGEPFTLNLTAGHYLHNVWIDTKTGAQRPAKELRVLASEVSSQKSIVMPDERRIGGKGFAFEPPDKATDWVLLLRNRE